MSEQLALSIPPAKLPTRPQGKKALAMLKAGGPTGVSGVEFVANYLFAYSQEVGRLKALGWDIVSEREENSAVFRYWLKNERRTEENA